MLSGAPEIPCTVVLKMCSNSLFYLAVQLLAAFHMGIGLAIQNETMNVARSLLSLETHLELPVRHLNHTEIWKQKHFGEKIPFVGLTKTNTLDKHCCKNGGTCMLGNFCACPKHFSGRHCEFDLRSRHCGFVAHGHWLPRKCALCRCFYGVMYCFPSGDCDAHEYHEDVKMAQSRGPVMATLPYLIILLTATTVLIII